MAKKPTQRKQPFVIEPLNWVAPEVDRDESIKRTEEEKQPITAKESRS
ncbi:hypothetical protein H0A66_01040 [Alcaligenaceae bacterium]|nr:hypothetical protein [Alcaligenaceae bacterium]